MQRDWDEELVQDREFKIGGELFEWIYPHWEVGAEIFDGDLTPEPNGDGSEPRVFSFKDDTRFAIEKIPLFLNPKNDSLKRFKALAARKTDAVPRFQFVQLYRWLVQVTGGLPTTAPSSEGSDGGDGQTGTGSADASPSTEETSSG